jgi:hypothetical protein
LRPGSTAQVSTPIGTLRRYGPPGPR